MKTTIRWAVLLAGFSAVANAVPFGQNYITFACNQNGVIVATQTTFSYGFIPSIQDRRLASMHDVLWSPYECRGVHRNESRPRWPACFFRRAPANGITR